MMRIIKKIIEVSKEGSKRLASPTPKFWKSIVRAGVTIGSIGGGIVGLAAMGVALPAILITGATYAITAGIVAGAVAKFGKIDVSDIATMTTEDRIKLYNQLMSKKRLNTQETLLIQEITTTQMKRDKSVGNIR